MSVEQQIDPPVRANGAPASITFFHGAWYEHWDRRMACRDHTHIYEDAGLRDHLRCKVCGKCRVKS